MDKRLIDKYLEYAETDEAKAVLFVKRHFQQTNGYWIDIINCDRYHHSNNPLHFRSVKCGFYPHIRNPKYPPKSDFVHNVQFNESGYNTVVRAITWEVAHNDIDIQKRQGIIGIKYLLTGVRYNKNNRKYKMQPPWLDPSSSFYGYHPRPHERTAYEYSPEWVYEFKSIQKLN